MKKLGFGLMRLPLNHTDDRGDIDMEQLKKMVDIFIRRGFTYFDTAWMYCGFKSENAVKEALADRYPRSSFKLATKLHAGYIRSKEDRDHIFNEQLKKTGVSYFDYYLLHDVGTGHYEIFEKLDCFRWLADKKAAGLVKHIGISFHDTADLLDQILMKHPEIEFVQLQLNYLDWDSDAVQSGRCYEVAVKYGKPVFVMEPVKGGTLAEVPEEVEHMMKSFHPDMSVSSWAIRFAASKENVKIVLSGMSSIEQMLDNTDFMSDFKPLGEKEQKILQTAVKKINESIEIPCTGCAYCEDGCPKKIVIPRYFSLYNADKQETKKKNWTPQSFYYERLTSVSGGPEDCIGCHHCEKVCPQHLPIATLLKKVDQYFKNK